MTEKLREQLNQIDAWLQGAGGLDLWRVLTALRGPDWTNNPTDPRKLATASVVRQVAFPGCSEAEACGAFYEKDSQTHMEVRREMGGDRKTHSHFRGHAQAAFEALGLRWDEVNS